MAASGVTDYYSGMTDGADIFMSQAVLALSLGQNGSYINQIENKKALPSLQGLFYICEYFGITPQEFFDEKTAYPAQMAELIDDLKKLDSGMLACIASLVKEVVTRQR